MSAVILLSEVFFIIKSHPPIRSLMVQSEKEPQGGYKATLTLADGSTITLNSQGKLMCPEQFGDTREVTLEGEAFFQINRKAAKPFIVHSAGLKTSVLGTSFNINTFGSESIEVTVVTGKVQVQAEYNEAQQAHLSPVALAKGEQAHLQYLRQRPEKN